MDKIYDSLGLKESATQKLKDYSRLLVEWNEKMNLTAITDEGEIAIKHFADCLTLCDLPELKGRVIDIGTGAGFPGMVLKIAKPELDITLLDSLNKRLIFLEALSNEIKAPVTLVHERAEDGVKRNGFREGFDTAVSRAVASLNILSELCLPYVKVGGYFLAMKGPNAEEELIGAKEIIKTLGGKIDRVENLTFNNMTRNIVIIRKIAQTPSKYPRNMSKIKKLYEKS